MLESTDTTVCLFVFSWKHKHVTETESPVQSDLKKMPISLTSS